MVEARNGQLFSVSRFYHRSLLLSNQDFVVVLHPQADTQRAREFGLQHQHRKSSLAWRWLPAMVVGLTLVAGTLAAEERLQRLPEVFYPGPQGPRTRLVPGPLGPSVPLDAMLAAPVRPVSTRPLLNEPLLPPAEQQVVNSGKPPGAKAGVLQAVRLTGTWLPRPRSGDLGMSDLEASVTLGFPLPTPSSPLVVTPYFAVHYLDGPTGPDLPARVYDASTQFLWIRPLSDRLTAHVAVTPGYHGDFEQGDADTFRLTGRGMGIWKHSDQWTLVAGVAYLDRSDLSVLPIGGVVWTPNDDWRIEVIAPRPRVARRLAGGYGDAGAPSWWGYVAGEFGGGVWGIERAAGGVDVITMRDYRVLLGLENKMPGRLNSRWEVGYVFGREIEYASATPDFKPDPTLMLRAGVWY